MTKLKEEFFKILPPTIYFFVALHLVMFIRVLMLEGTGLSPYSSASIAVTALILGKAVLLADMLPLINRFPNKPLIYNIAWKTVIYLLISAVLHYLERLIDFWRETGSFVAGNEKLLSVIIWPHFFAIQIILLVLIAMYCTVHELVRVIGREKALRIFFGRCLRRKCNRPLSNSEENVMHEQLQAIITVLSLINPAICAAMFARAVAGQSLGEKITDSARAAFAVLIILTVAALLGSNCWTYSGCRWMPLWWRVAGCWRGWGSPCSVGNRPQGIQDQSNRSRR